MKGFWTSIYFGFFLGFVCGTAISLAASAQAQIVCTTLGHFTTCDGTGQSYIQADLGNRMGVIIGPQATTPYVILQQPQPQAQTPIILPSPAWRHTPEYTAPVYTPPPSTGVYGGYQAPLPYPGGMGE